MASIVLPSEKQAGLFRIENPKYLFPIEFDIARVLFVIRQRLTINQKEALILFACKGAQVKMLDKSATLRDVLEKFRDEDGFLYLVYATENVYG